MYGSDGARGLDAGSLGTPVTALKVPCLEASERLRAGGVIVAVAVLVNVAFGVLEDDALVWMRPDAEVGSVLGGVDLGPAEVDRAAAEIEEELSRNRFIACLRRGARTRRFTWSTPCSTAPSLRDRLPDARRHALDPATVEQASVRLVDDRSGARRRLHRCLEVVRLMCRSG